MAFRIYFQEVGLGNEVGAPNFPPHVLGDFDEIKIRFVASFWTKGFDVFFCPLEAIG
jgi:hypothetical protein